MLNKFIKSDLRDLIILSICIVLFFLIYKLGFLMFVKKIIGIIFLIFGLIILIKFPQLGDYQPKKFSVLFILIGIFILLFGVYLLVF